MAPTDQPKVTPEAQVPVFSRSVCYWTLKWQFCTRNAAVPSWELPGAGPWGCSHGLQLPSMCLEQQTPGHQESGQGALPPRVSLHLASPPAAYRDPAPAAFASLKMPFPDQGMQYSHFFLCRACNSTASTVLTLASSCACVRFSGPSSRLPCGSIQKSWS